MRSEELEIWVETVINRLPEFLTRLKDEKVPGRFKYSLTGDIETNTKWGVGNTVFAAKNFYMLHALDQANVKEMASFIKSFQGKDGQIFDPLVQRRSFFRRYYNALLHNEWNNLNGVQTRRAETRQAFAALSMLGRKPNIPHQHIPYTREGIRSYIHSLDWRLPWGAGSHFSHLIFFIRTNFDFFGVHADDWKELIDYAFKEASKYRQNEGTWFMPAISIPNYQKINGAMKMMIAYEAADRDDFDNPEGLIDLCLSVVNDENACNNFNIICVLYHCSQKTDYRKNEVKEFCLNRLKVYKKHYWPEYGGFSFFERRANSVYYGAKISKGLEEPDIHGTHLFLWGITLITKILRFDDTIKLHIPIT